MIDCRFKVVVFFIIALHVVQGYMNSIIYCYIAYYVPNLYKLNNRKTKETTGTCNYMYNKNPLVQSTYTGLE